jgi:FtsH-binding integral membrane protein
VTRVRPNQLGAGLQYDRYFFSGMAVLILGTVFLGFAKTYFLAGVFKAPLPSWVIHVHGAAFTSWVLLLIVQTSLISAGRVDVHRRLGMVGVGLACVMVVLGALAGTDLLLRDGSGLGVNAKAFYAGTLGDMVIFGVVTLFAFRQRFNPAAHKRLILIATIGLIGAAINRWPFAFIERMPFMIDVFAYTFLLVLVAYDLWSLRRVHRATLWGGLFLVAMQQLELPIGRTAVWQNFATWVLERVKSVHGG